MVHFSPTRLDASFAALADATRRGVLQQLSQSDSTVTALAERFDMTVTGMKKHIGVLERAGLVSTEKAGRVRTCRLGPHRLEAELTWLTSYQARWAARFDALDTVLENLKTQEKAHARRPKH